MLKGKVIVILRPDTIWDKRLKHRRDAWEYRVYIDGVNGYVVSSRYYLTTRGVRKAAIKVGRTTGLAVFDRTRSGIQI